MCKLCREDGDPFGEEWERCGVHSPAARLHMFTNLHCVSVSSIAWSVASYASGGDFGVERWKIGEYRLGQDPLLGWEEKPWVSGWPIMTRAVITCPLPSSDALPKSVSAAYPYLATGLD